MSRFVIRTLPTGIKFDLKATNGQTVASSELFLYPKMRADQAKDSHRY